MRIDEDIIAERMSGRAKRARTEKKRFACEIGPAESVGSESSDETEERKIRDRIASGEVGEVDFAQVGSVSLLPSSPVGLLPARSSNPNPEVSRLNPKPG
jgi:hypothetical protein